MFDILCQIKTQNQLIDAPCTRNNNELLQREARPQTSSLQTYGLLTVLTLICGLQDMGSGRRRKTMLNQSINQSMGSTTGTCLSDIC